MIETEEQLDDLLTRPSDRLRNFIAGLSGPLVVLGASGKMGPTLAAMARRAAMDIGRSLPVIAVARFSDEGARRWLESRGVQTLQCDLLDPAQVSELPDADHVIYMAGRKFGTTDNPALTWAMNVLPPEYVCRRYTGSRIVAMSTGCVYPPVSVRSGGSREDDPLTPRGEYSNACVARERMFEYFSQTHGARVCLVRLNYAVELRYGVLVDIAVKVARGEPIDVSMGYLNCIWQGDANEIIIRALDLAAAPVAPLNLTGPDVLSVRALAERFGALMGRSPQVVAEEGATALLNDPSRAVARFGPPATPVDQVVEWTAAWIMRGGRLLGKPTHYEVTDGQY